MKKTLLRMKEYNFKKRARKTIFFNVYGNNNLYIGDILFFI